MGDCRMAHQELTIDTAEEEAREDEGSPKIDKVQMLRRIRGWVKADSRHRSKWEKEAKQDFGFVACDQWEDEDKKKMEAQGRVPVVFNRVLTIIKSICGSEINGRLETRYIPRGVEDTQQNELLSAASQWMSDQCDAEDEQSEAFEAAVICGMGWTEARMDYDEDPEGKYIEVEVDPFEMYADCKASKKNLSDARRITRVRNISITEARAMFPGVPDEELDAAWADNTSNDQKNPRPVEDQDHSNSDLDDPVTADRNDITLVHCQWWEKEAYWLVALEPDMTQPQLGQQPQEPEELDQEQYKQFERNAKKAGIRFQSAKLMRKVFKQAFVGNKILDYGPTPCPYEFSFQCITGERDRKNNAFFGFVRTMRDPQMWANKMLSNALHIANTTAKGGIIAEKNAFDDERQAESSYAQPNEISWAAEGAVQHGRIMPKPGTGDPSVYIKLLEFAISSIRDVSGVNLELLGLRDANQPGILEAQRKQAAMTVLASLFNSLRRFRKNIGRIRLHLIQEHMSDGRLIRIKGDAGGPQVAQLAKDRTAGDYDVVVADAPTSPNQKEQTWAMIQNILPVFKDMLTPDVTLALLKYSPFPTEVVEELRTLNEQGKQQAQQKAQVEQQLLAESRQLQNQNLQAKTAKDMASAQKTQVEAHTAQNQVQLGHVKEQADAHKAYADAQKSQADAQKSMADAESSRVQGRAAAMKTMAEANNAHMQGQQAAAEAQSKSIYQGQLDEAALKKLIAETTKTTIETMMMMQAQAHEQSMAEQALESDQSIERARFVSEQDQQQKQFQHQREMDQKAQASKDDLAKKQLSQKAAAQKAGGTKK